MLRTLSKKQIEKIKRKANLLRGIFVCITICYLNSLHNEIAHNWALGVCFVSVSLDLIFLMIEKRRFDGEILKQEMMQELTDGDDYE